MLNVLTRQDIIEALKNLGLSRGSAVEVHSSMSSMGFVEGGANTVINALIDVVGDEGTIVMSAYLVTPVLPITDEEKARGILAKVRFLAEDENCRTGMGIISDTFRKRPDVQLGKGVHRVCAWGHNAHLHVQGYEYLLSIDGWVLLIGVDINRCSSMHTVETNVEWPKEITEYHQIPDDIRQKYPESKWYIQYEDPNKCALADVWGNVSLEAERRGLIRRGKIGQAECMFFKGKDVVGIYKEFLQGDILKLFGVNKITLENI